MTRVLLTDSALRIEHIGEAIRLLESNGCELVRQQISPGEDSRLYPHLSDVFAAIALQAARNVVQAARGEVPADLVNRDVLNRLNSPRGS